MITINDNIKFDINPTCLALFHRVKTDPKHRNTQNEYRWTTVGYYTSVEHMLGRVVDLVGIADCQNLAEMVEVLKNLKKDISDMLEKLDTTLSGKREATCVTYKGKTLSDLYKGQGA